MDATAVMDRLSELGVVARATGGKLLLEPGSKVPPDLLVQVKEHKAEILARLTQHAESLLDRLRTEQVWLTSQHQRWLDSDTTADDDAEFARVWIGWWDLDYRLRAEHGFRGCINGSNGGCPEGFPCQGCSDAPAPAVAAQLALVGAMDNGGQ